MDQMLIVAGEYSLSTFEGTEQIFRPARMVLHPDYSASSKNADIMLIKVTPTSWGLGLRDRSGGEGRKGADASPVNSWKEEVGTELSSAWQATY